MAERRTLICDICGSEEPVDANSGYTWYAAILSNGDLAVNRRLELSLLAGARQAKEREGKLFHLCGASCVTLKISEFLGQKVPVQ